ncbi:MAG: glycosyl hydrolase [Capsulimonadaceae bacterium]|nr:glycosyl hydrolase [Capsulimonadaceae bacterium]
MVTIGGNGQLKQGLYPAKDGRGGQTSRVARQWMVDEFLSPPREFTLIPFWFWNDDLNEAEIARQIGDFDEHGVYGFVIHPRVGLPRRIGWMSEAMLGYVEFAVHEAARRGMKVVLYDEGMYPSGSSSGQVVAENPIYGCRALVCEEPDATVPDGGRVVACPTLSDGRQVKLVDRRINSVIRGLHVSEDEKREDTPPAADLLNPDAVRCFIRLVYDRYYERLREYFGTTIIGMFTDEPHLLGRCHERAQMVPWTSGLNDWLSACAGYDFTPHLAALFDDGDPSAKAHRGVYEKAVGDRLLETYYRPLHDWCEKHNVWLMGHPAEPDGIEIERFLHVPGQDIVWRWVEPGKPSGIEGPQSTQAKCTSSAMIHNGRRRNSNECYGSFGHEFTYQEMVAIANWLIVRGVNMIIPHAFYYSIRGFRLDERPPDVGPNSAWWSNYATFAKSYQRLCWLNTDCVHRCDTAILGRGDWLPWQAAKACFENQRDFNYLEIRDLSERAVVSAAGVEIAGMIYRSVVIDGLIDIDEEALTVLRRIAAAGRLIEYREGEENLVAGSLPATNPRELVAAIDRLAPSHARFTGGRDALRVRQVAKGGVEFFLLSNESASALEIEVEHNSGAIEQWDARTGEIETLKNRAIVLGPFELTVLATR